MRISPFILVLGLLVGCSGSEDPSPAEQPEVEEGSAEAETPAPPPLPPLPGGGELLGGRFEFVGAHNGFEVRHAFEYDGTTFTRIVNGRTTAAGTARVVASEPGRVSVEVSTDGAPPLVRTLVFSDRDNLHDAAAPEMNYRRSAELEDVLVAPEGSGVTE